MGGYSMVAEDVDIPSTIRRSQADVQTLQQMPTHLQSKARALEARASAARGEQRVETQQRTMQGTARAMLEEVRTLQEQLQQLICTARRKRANARRLERASKLPPSDVPTDETHETGRTEPSTYDEPDTTRMQMHEDARVDETAETAMSTLAAVPPALVSTMSSSRQQGARADDGERDANDGREQGGRDVHEHEQSACMYLVAPSASRGDGHPQGGHAAPACGGATNDVSDEQAARLLLAAFAQAGDAPCVPLEQGGREQDGAEPNTCAPLVTAIGHDGHAREGAPR